MEPAPSPRRVHWAVDMRGEGRAVRVAAHVEAGFLVISTWKADECVGTVRLVVHEAAELMAGMAECLAQLATGGEPVAAPAPPLDERVSELEQRVARLEPHPAPAPASPPPASPPIVPVDVFRDAPR